MEDGDMKKIEISAYGAPEEVAHCIDAPAVGDPGPDEVVFDVLGFPINPADISFCRGSYRLRAIASDTRSRMPRARHCCRRRCYARQTR
jgi:NADPH:quinone reductase-like Zn-dependent oxidoreductase